MTDEWFESGTRSLVGREVSAEIRARLAAQRISGAKFAAQVSMSQHYLATRLRDEKPFTLDDLAVIVERLGDDDVWQFVKEASERNGDAVFVASQTARKRSAVEYVDRDDVDPDDYVLAASDADHDPEVEAWQEEP